MARYVWVSRESVRAKALRSVIDHLALCICATRCGTVTRIFAAVQYTSLIVTAVFVLPASNYAVPVEADFFIEAVLVL